jgi:formyl-CoA transferase/CoA:oxalate CoA-transferase
MIAAPYCTQLLADMGAEVIKVEEVTRGLVSRIDTCPPGVPPDRRFSPYWLATNRNKESFTLDLENPRANAVLEDLIGRSDVVVENFSARTRRKFGLSESWAMEVNPRIIWASLTAYGRTGPDRDRGGQDLVAQARSGLMSITGDPDGPPMKTGHSSSDYLAGVHLAVGILAALFQRETTGRGQLVDISLLDSAVACLDGYPLWSSIAGITPRRRGNFHLSGLPYYSVFKCRDGHLAIAGTGAVRDRLFRLVGQPGLSDLPDTADEAAQTAWRAAVVSAIENWTAGMGTEEAHAELERIGVPNSPVRNMGDIWDDPQLQARGMIVEHEYEGRTVRTIGSPLHLSESPTSVRHDPPSVGADNQYVLETLLGYDDEQISSLAEGGALWGT